MSRKPRKYRRNNGCPGNRNSVEVAEEIMGVRKEEVPGSTEEIMDVQEVELVQGAS